jgi:hypothetical protein
MTSSHPPSLQDLLEREDGEISDTLRQLETVQQRLGQWLRPATELRRADRDSIRARLAAHDQGQPDSSAPAATAQRLADELARARLEIDALRHSQSWRLTRPLRMVHRWLYRLPGHD